jgi:hypothetical protein
MDSKAFKIIGSSVIVVGLLAGAFLAGGMSSTKSNADPAPTATATQNESLHEKADAGENLVSQQGEAEDEDVPQGGSSDQSGGVAPSQSAPQQLVPQEPAPSAPSAPVDPTPAPTTEPTPEPAPPAPVNVAPYVVSITPADDAIGVIAATNIVVTFSEPMDKADVQAAFNISHGNPGTFSWNPAATVMTFNPGANLAYGANVTLSISHTAADAEGLQMDDDFNANFKVLRQLSTTVYSQGGFDGHIYGPGVAVIGSHVKSTEVDMYVGTWSRGFLSFDLSGLPDDLHSILSAEVKVYQSGHHAGAYGGTTGNLLIRSVSYGTLDVGDFSSPAFTYCNALCLSPAPTSATLSSSAADGWKSVNALGPVRSDWTNRAARGERSQFLLRFVAENNGAGASVWAKFASGDALGQRPLLSITYLAP